MSNSKLFEEEIKFDLELNKDVMDVILNNYKKAYIMKKLYNTPEYNTMYTNAESNIDKEFVALEKITNALLKKIDAQQQLIQSDNTIINTLKKDVGDLEKKENVVKSESLASKPRYSDAKREYNYDNYYIGIQIVGILIVGYMFYSSYKDSNKPVASAKPNTTQPIQNPKQPIQNTNEIKAQK